ncbi:hypothetical protein [Algoriphagus winogradskyi]|uniref:YD repeat-containing protein n=1 Tax=Algoriphagus winogradskyi TaxID=237017 RepID=A0ABY1PJ44_9BACT|nr:hypothetical protein [Algoriphagus winogradskyi]SMP34852.1 YD repeat-containing protein [Algoriphagus winogradskyi]
MKNLLYVLAVGILISCESTEPPLIPEILDENVLRLHQVLEGTLVTPAGKLKSEFFYYGPETLQSRTDYYYDTQDRELLKVRIQNGDTTLIELNTYLANGKLDKTSVYIPTPSGFAFRYNFQRYYENESRKIDVIREKEGIFEQYSRYIFDELGRLSTYRRGTEINFDLHEYLYESENSELITGENYSQTGMTGPFYQYKYDYNDKGLLVSKSLKILGPNYRPAFEYDYNAEGKLIEEITNDLNFGTTPTEKKMFEYY